jgi:uncharacterized protein
VILLDTSGLLANYDSASAYRRNAARVLDRERELILSPFVLAELDYLVTDRFGQRAALEMLSDVAQGAFALEAFDSQDIAQARTIIERYADLGIGLTDASIVVLAERYGCRDILTLDQRHFRAMTALSGQSFRLLPLDG